MLDFEDEERRQDKFFGVSIDSRLPGDGLLFIYQTDQTELRL